MIGRERELELVESALADAKRNRVPAIARISGESGMGKTRFLSELGRDLHAEGWFVVQTACHTIQQHTPRLAANRIVAAAIERLGTETSRYTGGLEEGLTGFDAAVARAIGRDQAAQPIDRSGYVSTILQLFEGIAVDYDVAILCDDAQWIDSDSAQAILALPEKVSTGSICMVFAERGERLQQSNWPASIDVVLSELAPESSLRIIAAELPDLPPKAAEAVAQHAGGNPFELTALCEQLRDGGIGEIERSLRARTAKQLAALDADVREFVHICALLGDPIEHRILSEMYPDSATLERLIALSGDYIVNAGSEFRFKHAMLAQSVVSTIAVPIPLRRRIIETLQSPNLQELTDYERIAAHAAECGDLPLQRRALVALAKDAYRRQAWESTVSACERALRIRSGTLDPYFLSLYVLALRVFDREPEAIDFLRPELARYDLNESAGIGSLVGLLIAMLVELGRFDEALAIYRRYEPLIREPSERAPMVVMMMWGASWFVDYDLYDELSATFEALSDHTPSRYLATRNTLRAAFASLNGDSDEVRRSIAAAFANVDLEDARHPYLLNFSKLFFDFREDGCKALAARLLPLKEWFVRDAVDFWFYGSLCEATLAFFLGDWKTASDVVAATYRKSMPTARAAKILGIAAAMEAIGGAQNPFPSETEAVCVACWQERDVHSAMHLLPWWLQKHSNPGLEGFAEQQLLTHLERRAMPFIAVSYVPLAFTMWASAGSNRDALERIAAIETPRDRSRWGTAQWELARGAALRSLGRDEAIPVLRSAQERFRSLSSPLLTALASRYGGNSSAEDAKVLENIGLSPARRVAAPKRPTDLTAREWDVARLVGEGATNRQIAQKLFVSERTVEVHLSNIFGKLSLSSRAQLVRWLYENEARP